SRIAVVPFSGDVMPTSSLLAAATDPDYEREIELGGDRDGRGGRRGRGGRDDDETYEATSCVAERPGKDYSDTAPGSGHYVLREYTSNGRCSIDSSGMLQPMTNDKST